MSSRRWRPGLAVLTAALATSVLIAPAALAEGTIRVSSGAETIADQYIVVLKEGATPAAQTSAAASTIAAQHGGGKVGATWQHALRGFVINTSEQNAKRIAADARVSYVEQDARVRADATQPTPSALWGLDRIDQKSGRSDGQYISSGSGGRNVHAYVLDTGIRLSHNDFGGRASWGINTTGDGINTDCHEHGHGTHVAGTIGGRTHGVAKGVSLVAVKVLGCDGGGLISGVISGVNWVTANAVRPAVANMSLGASTNSALDAAVENSINSGITYTVAAGNANRDACTVSPARAPNAITVAATDRNDRRPSTWDFGQGSNFGPCVDLFAPGDAITSASNGHDLDTESLGGTSMAAPHVAGVAALHLQRHPRTPPISLWFELALVETTKDVVVDPGPGSPNRLLNSRYTFGNPDGDYTDDQRTDTTVWRPSTGQWFVRGAGAVQWGAPTDIPVPADYNGDGITDRAVWRPSTGQWFLTGGLFGNGATVHWGQAGDIPVAADYDGDSGSELAVWRPSTGQWFVRNGNAIAWGVQGDIPVPGDYNGDGLTDRAVWRPSTGEWFVHGQATVTWGINSDKPLAS